MNIICKAGLIGLFCAGVNAETFDPGKTYPAVKLAEVSPPACAAYQPMPQSFSSAADRNYQIAAKIWHDEEDGLYPQMYQLGEQAARAGHPGAMYLMAQLYTRGENKSAFYSYAESDPKKAEQYLNALMTQGYSDAFYSMAMIRNSGKIKTKTPASYYFWQAMQKGQPDAWFYIANLHINWKQNDKARDFLYCAAKNGSGDAQLKLALAYNLTATTQAGWDKAFNYLWQAVKSGQRKAYTELPKFNRDYKQQQGRDYLSPAFLKRAGQIADSLYSARFHDDPYRKSQGRDPSKRGTPANRYPALENILPLPPARLPAWNGDLTPAMSPQDAYNYRQDYTLTQLNGMLGRKNEIPGKRFIIVNCDARGICNVRE